MVAPRRPGIRYITQILMTTSPTSETAADSALACECQDWMRSVCAGEPFYREHKGKRYCVLHFPGIEKSADFNQAFRRKLENKDFNFAGVWFPDDPQFVNFNFCTDADFTFATFAADANFSQSTFSSLAYFVGATFKARAEFNHAVFEVKAIFLSADYLEPAYFFQSIFKADAIFRQVVFRSGANFGGARFSKDADFGAAAFMAPTEFIGTEFMGPVDFEYTKFYAETRFRRAAFADYARFAGHERYAAFGESSLLDLAFTRIDKPHQISFHTLILHAFWFTNVDARKFEFVNVEWRRSSINEEIAKLRKRFVLSPHRLLAIAYRHLAVNAEDNQRYNEASRFRYMAMDARRLEHLNGLDFRRLSWWYWLASGYGERVLRAAVVLLAILVVCAALYTQVGFARWAPRVATESEAATAKQDETGAPLKLSRALIYSAAVTTLQRPEPRPATGAAQTIVLLQTILGPVQAALLALAIRRKFMR